MYLRELEIEGFKSFGKRFSIEFNPGLNVLVGENGAGKTGVISALRQLFLDSESGKRSVSDRDFYKPFTLNALAAEHFHIKAVFDGMDVKEKVALISWCGMQDEAILNLHVANKEFRGRFRQDMWGGNARTAGFDSDTLDLIHCIYLPPLRDAEQKMKEGRQSRLSKLIKALCKKELAACRKQGELHKLELKVRDFNNELSCSDDFAIKQANKLVADSLRSALGEKLSQSTTIQFSEVNFTRIVEGLRLLYFPNVANVDATQFRSLDENSLGYNNLLYIASILAELSVEDQEDFGDKAMHRLLLIEEPEAHLHPQLQIRLLKHLQEVAEKENIQVIVTTHSTVISSAVSVNNIIHLSGGESPIAVPLRQCGLPTPSLSFVDRWLDVTKSNLLFSKGVILVEGIAEAIVVPELARLVLKVRGVGLNTLEDFGVSVINLNGIYFKHFMQIFCDVEGVPISKSVPIRCAGLTDNDPAKSETIEIEGKEVSVVIKPHVNNIHDGKNHALKLIPEIEKSVYARLYTGKLKTFEYDMAMTGTNLKSMLGLCYEEWPTDGSVKAWFKDSMDVDFTKVTEAVKSDYAHELLERIDSNDMGKGLFAQLLADKISLEGDKFIVPDYIRQAILWSCGITDEIVV
jgi:putative ATP-dependent endonuclease of OLD family